MPRTLTPSEFEDVVAGARREAFKLETLDAYVVEGEGSAFERWCAGDRGADQLAAADLGDWLAIVRRVVAAGATFRRVRVVTEPPSEYIRFESRTVPLSEQAGETIRYLPRHHPAVADLPGRDLLLVDDRVIIMHFTPGGAPLRDELHDDPTLVEQARRWRDIAWQHAIPYVDYIHHLE